MKIKENFLKVYAILILFITSSCLVAQTLPNNTLTQTVCVNTLSEPYEVIPNLNSTYNWSIIDQATGITPLPGVADITLTANDWWIEIDWTTVGVYELSLVETDVTTTCSSSPIVLTITVEDNANYPNAINPPPICLNDPNPTMTVTSGGGTGNSVFNWYSDAALTNLLASNTAAYTDPILYPVAQAYNYWVTEQSINGCEGPATQVSIVVNPLPTAPILLNTPYEACFGLSNPLMEATGSLGGTNFNWYDASGFILPMGTNVSTFTSTEVNPSTYTYFVEEIVGSCTSPQTQFTFTIHPPPASPSINPSVITICEGDVPNSFVAITGGSSGSYSWYDVDPILNPSSVAIFSGSSFFPNQTASGSYTYWLTETDLTTTCISAPSIATFIVNELPLLPLVSANPSAVICEGQASPTFTAGQAVGSVGTGDYNWYDSNPAINPNAILLNSGTTCIPSQTAVGIYTIWLTETNSVTNCEGPALAFTFEIVALPPIPTMVPNPIEICFGDANMPFNPTGVSSSGANLIWYDDVALTNQVGTGATFTAPSSVVGNANTVSTYSYWVVDQPGSCVSPPLEVHLQINPIPSPGPIWHN